MKKYIEVNKIVEANEDVKGTKDYNKYTMQMDSKINGLWKFITWSIPHQRVYIKTYKDTIYLITDNEEERYTVNEAVKELLDI